MLYRGEDMYTEGLGDRATRRRGHRGDAAEGADVI